MATRSRIAVEIEGGKVLSVYCHNDGYLEGVGQELLEQFPNGTDSDEVLEFIQEGDRSTVDLSYADWRGEDCPPQEHDSVDDFFNGDIEEFGYLYTQEGEWLVKQEGGFFGVTTLEDALNGEDDEYDEDEEEEDEDE
jgi:hypothetical protein